MTHYPSEIHKLLKIGGDEEPDFHGAPHGLPEADDNSHREVKKSEPAYDAVSVSHSGAAEAAMPQLQRVNFKGLLVYPVIFLVAFVFFYLVLNFSSIFSQIGGWFAKPQAEEILGENLEEYQKWINNYFYAVGDLKLLEPNNDLDHDGLSNHDEFIMRINPIVADSDNDGFSDGIEVINRTNVWGDGQMNKNQRTLADKLDSIMINNRISFSVSQNRASIAGANTQNYDLDIAGRLSIPKLKIQVPLIWTKDPAHFDEDLTKGVVHYPGTALPGENGVIYVSGHSSDYFWKRDPMANIFSKLNHLSNGDDVFIDIYGEDGKVYNYRYQVTGSKVYAPDDQEQFFDNSGLSKLNLSTCWPIGTSKDRLVVTAVSVGL